MVKKAKDKKKTAEYSLANRGLCKQARGCFDDLIRLIESQESIIFLELKELIFNFKIKDAGSPHICQCGIKCGDKRLMLLGQALSAIGNSPDNENDAVGRSLELIKKIKGFINDLHGSNQKFVASIANDFIKHNPELEVFRGDFEQVGGMGLCTAGYYYDGRPDCEFHTYSSWWIRQAIIRFIYDNEKTIRRPVHIIESINRYKRSFAKLVKALNRKPNEEELAEDLDVPVEKVRDLSELAKDPLSLDYEIGDSGTTLIEMQAVTYDGPEAAYDIIDTKELINKILSQLSPRNEKMMRRRFGIGFDEHTLQAVATQFSVSRERVRQVEAESLKKLKKKLKKLLRIAA